MPVLFLIAIVAVLVGIFFTATGRGGELAYEQADHAPLDLGPVSAADIVLLRPPTAMWGYNMQVTDAALDQISRAMRERDVTIAYLQEQIVSLARGSSYAEPKGAHARLDAGRPLAPETPLAPDVPLAPEILPYPGATWASEDTSIPEPAEPTQTHPIAEDTEPFEVPGDTEPFAAAAAAEFPAATEVPATEVPATEVPATEVPGTQASAAQETPAIPETPEPPAARPAEATTQAARPPQTPLVLKASAAAKAPPAPEPHEATQPSKTLQDPEGPGDREDRAGHEATQPSETLASHDTQGPQGVFDTYGWWAEQKAAAREEATQPGAGEGQEDDPMAAAEEQGW